MSHSVEKDEIFNSVVANKIIKIPVYTDIMSNITNLSFNDGSLVFNKADESIYYGNGSTLIKLVSENEAGTVVFKDDVIFEGDALFNSLRSDLMGFTNDGIIDIYVDSVNGDDANTGVELTSPKKTLIDAINTVGARPNSRINLLPGNYILDGDSPYIYSNSIENKLTIQGYNYPYEVVDTYTVDSTTTHQYGDDLEISKVVLNIANAPAIPGGQWVRYNNEYYTIIASESVENVSLTILSNTVPFDGAVVEVVTPTVNVTVSNLAQVLGDLFMCDMNIVNTSSDTVSQNVGIMHFTRVNMDITSGISVGNGGTLEYNYCVLTSSNASSITNAGAINFNRTVYTGSQVTSYRGVINNDYSYLNFDNFMNAASVYTSTGSYQIGTFYSKFSTILFTGFNYDYNTTSDYFLMENSNMEMNDTCSMNSYQEYNFQTCKVTLSFDSDVTFVGRAVPISASNQVPALIQFKQNTIATILGHLTLNYDVVDDGNAYINSDQYSRVQLKPRTITKTNAVSPITAFFLNIMSDMIINFEVRTSNLNGITGHRIQMGTDTHKIFIDAYPNIDETYVDFQTSTATNATAAPGSTPGVLGPMVSSGLFCRFAVIE